MPFTGEYCKNTGIICRFVPDGAHSQGKLNEYKPEKVDATLNRPQTHHPRCLMSLNLFSGNKM